MISTYVGTKAAKSSAELDLSGCAHRHQRGTCCVDAHPHHVGRIAGFRAPEKTNGRALNVVQVTRRLARPGPFGSADCFRRNNHALVYHDVQREARP